MRSSSLQEFVGEGFAFAVFEGETRQENPIDKTLHQCRNATPPDGENKRQVIGPQDIGLGVEQVGFQGLGLVVAVVQDGIESQIAQAQNAYFVAGRFGAGDVGVGEGRAEAGAGRVAEDDQDALAHGGGVLKVGDSG